MKTAFDTCVETLAWQPQGEAGLMLTLSDMWACLNEATSQEMPVEMGSHDVTYGPFTEARALCAVLSMYSNTPVHTVEVLMKTAITMFQKGTQQ